MGITSCALLGEVEGAPALLNIFITACSGPPLTAATAGRNNTATSAQWHQASNSSGNSSLTLYISGHFFLHNPTEHVKTTQISMSSTTKAWASKPGALRLK